MNLSTDLKKHFFLLFGVCFMLNVAAQNELSLKMDYVEQYKDIAIEEMRIYRIPASITLALLYLETLEG